MAERSAPASGSEHSRGFAGADPRALALGILRRARQGGARPARLLAAVHRRGFPERDLRLATELLYGTLRWRPALDAIARQLSRRRPPPADLADVLHLALYQILFLDRVPAHAAVSRAVDQARALGGSRAAGFVNALLRAACRQGRTLLEPPPDTRVPPAGNPGWRQAEALARRYAHPPWLVRRWLERYGAAATGSLLEFDQRAPELALWPAPDAGDLGGALQAAGVECAPARFVPGALRARGGTLPFTPLHRQGRLTIQDEASQLVIWMLERPIRGPVLDLCAGSGGKTAQMIAAASPSAWVVAGDRSRLALRALRARLRRRRLPPPALLGVDWESGGALRSRFEVVLLDAPCTGTGVLRRRPEIKERLRPSDIGHLTARQDRLLEEAARRTAPGGELLYAVCSLEPEEGEERVEAFLRGHPEFERAGPADGFPAGARTLVTSRGDLRTLPWRDEVDGFFASRLRRRR